MRSRYRTDFVLAEKIQKNHRQSVAHSNFQLLPQTLRRNASPSMWCTPQKATELAESLPVKPVRAANTYSLRSKVQRPPDLAATAI